jgi:ribosomal protein S12
MPTIEQLIRFNRIKLVNKNKSPALKKCPQKKAIFCNAANYKIFEAKQPC